MASLDDARLRALVRELYHFRKHGQTQEIRDAAYILIRSIMGQADRGGGP